MKSKNIFKIILVLMAIVVASCDESFLDIVPRDRLTSDAVFETEAGADLFLNDIYASLPDFEIPLGVNYDNVDFMSPYTIPRHKFTTSFRRTEDRALTANTWRGGAGFYNHSYPQIPFQYPDVRSHIRKCNLFMESISEAKENYSEEWYKKRYAEARVLRAYFYHFLWMAYGGVPLVTEVLNVEEMGDDIFKPSASIRELYEFMNTECEEASKDLPNEVGNGHITQGAALALKAWISLYMGDIAKDPRPSQIGAPDLIYAESCYQTAAKACKDIMDLGTYSLFPSYNDQFLEPNNNNSESIWAIQHISTTRFSNRTLRMGPFWSGNGNVHTSTINPTQELVDIYRMADGLNIDESPLYNPQRPYINREPRFYESIIADSSYYAGKLFTLEGGGGNETLIKPAGGQVSTGYYRRKGINENLNTSNFNTDAANLPVFRYGEVLLMYAEAKIKASEVDFSVEEAINQVRERGGIPTISESFGMSLSAMSFAEQEELIWNERQVELVWEYKAYWDVVRTRRAETMLNQPNHGVKRGDDGSYEYFVARNNTWGDDKFYLFPIYLGWLESNPVWMDPGNQVNGRTAGQNPGY